MSLRALAKIEVGEVAVCIRGDLRRASLPLLWTWWRLPTTRRSADLTYDLLLKPRRKRVVRNGRSLASSRSVQRVLEVAEFDIYREIVERTPTAPLHAGGVVVGGKAVAILGDSGLGKSSLTLELVRQGAQLLGDEYLYLQPDGRVSGLPRSIQPETAPDGTSPLHHPAKDEIAYGYHPVQLVVALQRPRTPEATFTSVPGAAGAIPVLAALLRRPRPSDLQAIASLASQAPVVSLAREGIAQSADLVLKRLERSALHSGWAVGKAELPI